MAMKMRKLYSAPTGLQAGEEMLLSVSHDHGKVTVWFRPVTRKDEGAWKSESFMMFDGRDKFAPLAVMPRFNQKKFDALVGLVDANKNALAQLAATDLNAAVAAVSTLAALGLRVSDTQTAVLA